jgi:hypothetical protein
MDGESDTLIIDKQTVGETVSHSTVHFQRMPAHARSSPYRYGVLSAQGGT